MDLYEDLSSYNDKAIIYSPKLIRKKYTTDDAIAPFNDNLKERVENYVDVDTTQLQYLSDGVHFSDADVEYIFQVFRDSVGMDLWSRIHDSIQHMMGQARRRMEDL